MASVKGVCPKCGAVVEINKKLNEPNFECASCHKVSTVESAINNYNKIIEINVKRAEICMKSSTDYQKAYEYYHKNMELKPEDIDCLCGTVLAKVYQSDLIHCTISEASSILIDNSENIEIGRENIEVLAGHLHEIYSACLMYLDLLCAKVKDRKLFLDDIALELYKDTNKQLITFIDAYLDIHKALEELGLYLKDLPEDLNVKKKELLSNIESEFNVKNTNIDLNSRLDFEGKKIRKNKLFKDNSLIFKIRIALYIGMGIGFITSIVGLILTTNNSLKVPALITLGIGLVLFVGCYFVGHNLRSKSLGLTY